MSEFQYVGFRAIDAPVTDKNLEFMHKQSSRAEITPWSFDNEYHYGDFRGDAVEMLRRGYDFHFHYANFGVRKLMIRFAGGLPDASAAEPYFVEESLFLEDKKGRGGILCVEPFYESGELDDLWDLDSFFDRLLPLRSEILDGDLRPLYLAHLAVASDGNHDPDEEKEASVPAGLDKLTNAQQTLAELYGLSKGLLAAAAENSPPLPDRKDPTSQYAAWLRQQPESTKTGWLTQLLADPHSAVRREVLAEFQKSQGTSTWPTIRLERTIAELMGEAEGIQRDLNHKAAEKAARQRAKQLADMAADPTRTLRETEQLVKQRSVTTYQQVAKLLADLREALAGSGQSSLAERQALKLKNDNPKLNHLTAELRRQGFLRK